MLRFSFFLLIAPVCCSLETYASSTGVKAKYRKALAHKTIAALERQ
jgi:hypothetical protein